MLSSVKTTTSCALTAQPRFETSQKTHAAQPSQDTYEPMVAALRQKRKTHQPVSSRKALRSFLGSEAFDNLSRAADLKSITRFQGVGNSGRFNEENVRKILLAGRESSLLNILDNTHASRDDILESVLLLQDMLCLEDVMLESERRPILQLRDALIPLIGPTKAQADQVFGPEGARANELYLKIKKSLNNPQVSIQDLLALEQELSRISFMPNRETLLGELRNHIVHPIETKSKTALSNYLEIPDIEIGHRFETLMALQQQISSLEFFPEQNRMLVQIRNALETLSLRTQAILQELPDSCESALMYVRREAWKSLKYPQMLETLEMLKELIGKAESVRQVLGHTITQLSELYGSVHTLSELIKILESVGWKKQLISEVPDKHV